MGTIQGRGTATVPHALEPLAIRPAQFFGRPSATTGERRLMLAILEEAIATYRRTTPSRERREAERWIDSPDRRWVFSFERICQMLDFEPGRIRRALRATRSELAA